MKHEMKLSQNDKQILLQWGYEPKDLRQIQDAVNLSEYRLYDNFHDNDGIGISAKEAYKLLGQETFLSGIGRSAFHWDSSRSIDGTNNRYSVHFDSGEMLGGKPHRHIDYKGLSIDDVEAWKEELANKDVTVKFDSTTNHVPCNQGQLLANELVCELQKTTAAYNEGEFDDCSYSDGYYDAHDSVRNSMSHLQYSEDAITEFKQYSEKVYKTVDESMYNGDHDEEDYYDGFYKGIGDAANYLKLDHSWFKEFKLWEEKIEDNDSLQDR